MTEEKKRRRKKLKIKKMTNRGNRLITFLIIIAIVVILILLRERQNSRKFILLLFVVFESNRSMERNEQHIKKRKYIYGRIISGFISYIYLYSYINPFNGGICYYLINITMAIICCCFLLFC